MKFHNSFFDRLYNDLYNYIFKKLNKIKIDKTEKIQSVKESNKNLKHSNSLQTVWLLNLDRLYNLARQTIITEKYHFLDVGCGNGISLIYAIKKLKFSSYQGFDFINEYVEISKKNIKSSLKINEINLKKNNIEIFKFDACDFLLDKNKSFFIFIFNSFDDFIMKKFIENNLPILKQNKSVIAYANYNQLHVIKEYSKNVLTIDKYKLALIFF